MTNDEQTANSTEPEENWIYKIVDYFKVIEPYEIQEMDAPPFGVNTRGSEEEYKEYMEDMQPLFDEYDRDRKIHTIEYKTIADVRLNMAEHRKRNHFNTDFLEQQCINVRRDKDGTYKVTTNGRHRMYVAKKYGLRVLVHVSGVWSLKKELEITTDTNMAIDKRKGR